MISFEQYIRESAITRVDIDTFLDPNQPTWAQFDSELGYILGNDMPKDGIDSSYTISTVQANGRRSAYAYSDRSCRINTYGNSFTQCHQVSDGETWQEYLAAHLGEPIQNFGVGGYGVYQAYRRMLRTEATDNGAEYIILYIWGDDHYRSLLRCRHILIHRWWDHAGGRMFHGNFWANLEIDLNTGNFVEKNSLISMQEDLYQMTDSDFMLEATKDDLMLQLSLFDYVDFDTLDSESLNILAEMLGVSTIDRSNSKKLKASISKLRDAYGFSATKYIVKQTLNYCQNHQKEMMVITLCPRVVRQLIEGHKRYDQEIVDFLVGESIQHFDMNLVHAEDYRSFRLSIDDYFSRYFIGHYNPTGNHLFAYSLKGHLVNWLDPKPITYRSNQQETIDFTGYLLG
ncbi:MAG: hypothetical protein VCF25_13335 [Candidatus Poribacteria bacterium]